MEDVCDHCEYGNRFIDLGECPECHKGRIVGDLHTYGIFCSNLHAITSVAVDFCGKQHCINMIYGDYNIILSPELSREQLISVSGFVNKSPVEIYKTVKSRSSFCDTIDFKKMLKIGKYLYSNNIDFQVIPSIPIINKLCYCFPVYNDDYKWVTEKYK